jgi:hypothetical protein
MDEIFWLYLFTRLDAIRELFTALSILAATGILVAIMGRLIAKVVTPIKSLVAVWITLVLISVALPSKQDAVLILAGVGVIEAAKSEEVRQFAGKSVEVIEKAMDDFLKEKK